MSSLAEFTALLIAAIAILLVILWRWFGSAAIRRVHPILSRWSSTWDTGADPRVSPPLIFPAPLQTTLVSVRWTKTFLAAAMLVYFLTRLIGLERFPIYFFADEAAQTVLAADLVRDGFRAEGVFLPTYFYNVDKYSLGVTVYLQLIPYLLFGKSILVTRATAVLTAGLGALAVSLTLIGIFRYPHGWAGGLLLGLSPAWFIHGRTAFETAAAVAFYTVFLYAYLRYLYGSPRYIPWAGIAAAFAFYSYNPARLVVVATLLVLGITNFRIHWANRKVLLRHIWLALLALPYLRFQAIHPFSELEHLSLLNSYWVQPLSFLHKIELFGQEYLRGVSPLYWYLPNDRDLIRHIMRGYGHILWVTLPFALVGLFYAVRNWREPGCQVILATLCCAPLGGAVVETFITRSLFVLIPVTLLTGIGLARTQAWVTAHVGVSHVIPVAIFILLAGGNIWLLRVALTEGPTWFEDYGLYGMQYGAAQVFGEIARQTAVDPDLEFVVSPRWTHGLSMLVRFFLEDPVPVVWGVVDDYLEFDYPLNPDAIYVLLPDEYSRARASDRFAEIKLERIVQYPNGQPGFYFAQLRIADD